MEKSEKTICGAGQQSISRLKTMAKGYFSVPHLFVGPLCRRKMRDRKIPKHLATGYQSPRPKSLLEAQRFKVKAVLQGVPLG
jgi:hypothetical protein